MDTNIQIRNFKQKYYINGISWAISKPVFGV